MEAVAVAAAAGNLGAGVSIRRAHVAEAIAQPATLDLIEIVADHYFEPRPRSNAQLQALCARFVVVPHALDLSLGSADGISLHYLRRLGELIDIVRPPYWSEHIAFTRAGGRAIGHLAPLPRTHEALDVLQRNIERVRAVIETPLILENIACPFDIPYADMDEPEFLARIVERTGCGLLLDVANLYYNALNRGNDPYAVLRDLPLHAVVQCHLAGGHLSHGEWVDSHAHGVPEPVWDLFAEIVARSPVRAAIVERDENLPPFAELATEAARARAILLRNAA